MLLFYTDIEVVNLKGVKNWLFYKKWITDNGAIKRFSLKREAYHFSRNSG